MHNRLIIIGAGGHGKVIADIALKIGYKEISFLDDNAKGECFNLSIVGTIDYVTTLNDRKTDFVIAVGNSSIRKKIAENYDVNWVTLIHPSAVIATNVEIGKGTTIMAGAVINPDAKIGEHCIINTSAVIEHDNVIENYVHISPNATLGGTVTVGESTHIGIGATAKNNV
ncbi:MAG: acetyltransferase, partial [Clostridia bacterium]|nr:acetyltransferase [Clostridia bacterium]